MDALDVEVQELSARIDAAVQQAVEEVRLAGRGVTADQLGKRLGITRDAAWLRLKRGMKAGLLVRPKHGVYEVAPVHRNGKEGSAEKRT
jgi:hypothetical protein